MEERSLRITGTNTKFFIRKSSNLKRIMDTTR